MASLSLSLSAQQPENHEHDNRSVKEIFNELLSTLPREQRWIKNRSYYQYQGFWCEEILLEGLIWAQKNFKAQDSDIFIATSPKCGTTWCKALAFAIMNRNQYDDSNNPLLKNNPHVCVPFIELLCHQGISLDSLPTPRLLSAHASYNSLPKSIVDSGSKVVYVTRDPKDVFVSFYYFTKKITPNVSDVLPVDELFDLFCKGVSLFGPFWDHVLGYWNASLERPDKVLFLKYEDMKADTEGVVKKLAEFIGRPFSPEEESHGAVREVMKLCSMETLSNLEVNRNGDFSFGDAPELKLGNHSFFRKGTVGDSKNLLTADMIQRLDRITEQRLGGSGLNLLA